MRGTVSKRLRRQHGNPAPEAREYDYKVEGRPASGGLMELGARGTYRRAKKAYREGR